MQKRNLCSCLMVVSLIAGISSAADIQDTQRFKAILAMNKVLPKGKHPARLANGEICSIEVTVREEKISPKKGAAVELLPVEYELTVIHRKYEEKGAKAPHIYLRLPGTGDEKKNVVRNFSHPNSVLEFRSSLTSKTGREASEVKYTKGANDKPNKIEINGEAFTLGEK